MPEHQNPQMRALSVRQPHAEAIIRGVKSIEHRTRATKVRGRIYVYASKLRYPADTEARLLQEYGIDDCEVDDLPRGVIVGTVELVDCKGGDWSLRNPVRHARQLTPTRRPQPIWFYPF